MWQKIIIVCVYPNNELLLFATFWSVKYTTDKSFVVPVKQVHKILVDHVGNAELPCTQLFAVSRSLISPLVPILGPFHTGWTLSRDLSSIVENYFLKMSHVLPIR